MSTESLQIKNDPFSSFIKTITPYVILAFAIFLTYANIYDNAFLYDDQALIVQNQNLQGWSRLGHLLTGSTMSGVHISEGFYRPVQMLLYFIVARLGGSVVLFHLLNLTLHVANTCFVYRLGTKLRFNAIGVFLVALIWGLHPLNTEAVTYMSATADLLFSFFCLWALIVLIPDITPSKIYKIIPLFVLGLLSKETSAMFPLLVMACIFLLRENRTKVGAYICTWPLWCISILYIIWATPSGVFTGPPRIVYFPVVPDYVLDKLYSEHIAVRFYTFLATLPSYISLLIWPVELHMERAFTIYTDPWHGEVALGAAFFLIVIMTIIYSLRTGRAKEMSWGLLWFGAAHAPQTGLLIPINALFLEHWMYLPAVGLFLGAMQTIAKALEARTKFLYACSALAFCFACILSFKTYAQNAVWHDPVSFYGNILHYNEQSIFAHSNLGNYYSDHGELEKAFEHYNRAVEISDTNATMRYNMALAYLKMPNADAHISDAIDCLKKSIQLDSHFYRSYVLLIKIYDQLGDKEQAQFYQDKATALQVPK